MSDISLFFVMSFALKGSLKVQIITSFNLQAPNDFPIASNQIENESSNETKNKEGIKGCVLTAVELYCDEDVLL